MQAAGVVTSIWQNKGAQKMIRQGRDMERAATEMNMAANNYEFQESSLESMKQLRQNIGSQIVAQAARGTGAGTEGAVGSLQKSISASAGDVGAKRMRMLARESELRAANILSGLHTLKSETDLGRRMSGEIFEAASTGLRQLESSALASKFGFGK